MDEAFQTSSVFMLGDFGAVIDRRVEANFSVFQSFLFGFLNVCFPKKKKKKRKKAVIFSIQWFVMKILPH